MSSPRLIQGAGSFISTAPPKANAGTGMGFHRRGAHLFAPHNTPNEALHQVPSTIKYPHWLPTGPPLRCVLSMYRPGFPAELRAFWAQAGPRRRVSYPMPRPNSPDRLNPDWCRLRTGGTEILPGQEARAGVPLPGLAGSITSWTGPSYRPRGTPWISASCGAERAGGLAS